jgi:hypothetical protein
MLPFLVAAKPVDGGLVVQVRFACEYELAFGGINSGVIGIDVGVVKPAPLCSPSGPVLR